jgi:hypothetical protein
LSLKLDPKNPLATPVRTAGGFPARLICVDRKQSGFPIIAVAGHFDEEIIECTLEGRVSSLTSKTMDIVNVPVRKSSFGNLYKDGGRSGYSSRDLADKSAGSDRIAILEIIEEDGIPVEAKIHKVEK